MSLAFIFVSMAFVLGIVVSPLALAVLIQAFGADRGARYARKSIRLGLTSIYKPVVTFNNSSDLTLKKRSYDETHDADYVTFGGFFSGVKRYLHDPKDSLHSFYGVPFGFVQEHFGVVVDPRHCDLGREMRREQQNNQYEYRVERGGTLHESVKAVFERPRGRVGVRLPDVETLVGGSFDSKVVDRIREYYRKGQEPRSSTTALRQLLVPIAAFVGVVLLGMFAAGQSGGGGGGAPAPTNESTVQFGSALLVLGLSTLGPKNWRDTFVGLVLLGLVGGFAAVMLLAFPAIYPLLGIPLPLGLWVVIAIGAGMAIPPFVATWLGRSLGPIGMALGKLYLAIGFLGFSRPVIDLQDGVRYEVVEYDPEDFSVEPKWYRFAMTRIGIAYPSDEVSWPESTTLSLAKVKAMADGGTETDAPSGHVATEIIELESIKGFVPKSPREDNVFVRTDRTTGWFSESGQDRRLMVNAIQSAKEEFGGGSKPMGDKWILGASLAAMAMGALFDWVVFF